ncbi:hypothetical protein vseg_013654 [Gypsophila vaccaria]
MASLQFPSLDDKAGLEKFMQEVAEKAALETDTGASQDNISTTFGFSYNFHKNANTDLQILDQHHWSGKSDTNRPFRSPLKWRQLLALPFKHEGPLPLGSVAGVAYADGDDSTARKWLVAFDRVNSKVYVEAGPIGEIDWNVIKVRLDLSGNRSESVDQALGGKAVGFISGNLLFVFFSN